MKNKAVITLGILTLLSGACAITYELLFLRSLTTLMGDIYYVPAAVLSAFMLGIGLGARLAKRFIRHLYLMELGAGLYALALPVILSKLSDSILMTSISSSPLLTILTSFSIIFPSTVFIGFSIPLFSLYMKNAAAEKKVFNTIFSLYHLGTFLCVIIVEFWLIRSYGIKAGIISAGIVNLVIGGLLWRLSKDDMLLKSETVSDSFRFTFHQKAALSIASFTSACFQMFFLQLCFQAFKPFRENLSIGISVSLAGLFLGAILVKKFQLRFSTLMLLMALSLALTFSFYKEIIELYLNTQWTPDDSESLMISYKFLFGFLLALLPMTFFGALIPSLIQDESKLEQDSGQLLWISCIAGAIGYISYVYLIHELVPIKFILCIIVSVGVFCSAYALRFKYTKAHYSIAGVTLLLCVLMLSRWSETFYYAPKPTLVSKEEADIQIYKSGPDHMALLSYSNGNKFLAYNGHTGIAVTRKYRINHAELLVGLTPALSATELDKALVLGLGTGMTASTTAQYFQHTDVVEINEACFKMLPDLTFENMDIANNPNVFLHHSDGRSFLIGKEQSYDAIINTIPSPLYGPASKIYTIEFYDRVVKALKPDGIFCTWLATTNMTGKGIESILSALNKRFKYCDLRIIGNGYYMVTCSQKPIKCRSYNELQLSKKLDEHLTSSIRPLKIDEFIHALRISKNIFAKYSPEGTLINTDNLPVVEFYLTRFEQMNRIDHAFFFKNRDLLNIDLFHGLDMKDKEKLKARAEAFNIAGPHYYKKIFKPLLEEF